MAFKMRGNPFKQKETEKKVEKWIEGSEKAGNVLLDRAKKKCAEKGGTWNAEKGECVVPSRIKGVDWKEVTKGVKHGE